MQQLATISIVLMVLTSCSGKGGEGASCAKPEDCAQGLTCLPDIKQDPLQFRCLSPDSLAQTTGSERAEPARVSRSASVCQVQETQIAALQAENQRIEREREDCQKALQVTQARKEAAEVALQEMKAGAPSP